MSDKSIVISEKQILDQVHSMAIESLCPETFDKWQVVKSELELIRQRLNPTYRPE